MGFVRFKNGATMYVEASWLLNTTGSQHTTICGTLGGLELRGDGVMVNGERPDEKGEMKLFSELREPTDADREFFKDEKLSDSEYEAASGSAIVTTQIARSARGSGDGYKYHRSHLQERQERQDDLFRVK